MTIELTTILKYQLIFLAISKLLVSGEWIEMPQFSDDSKVYKLSIHDSDNFHNKYSNSDRKTAPKYNVKTIDQMLSEFGNADRNISSGTENSVLETATIEPSNLPKDPLDYYVNNGDDIFMENVDLQEVSSIEEEASTTVVPSTLELPTEESSISSTEIPILPVKKSESSSPGREETVKRMGLEDYLPMDMLRKVHETLKAQPSTMKGKIRFLKQFEKDLVAEIEARLSAALTPSRQKRGAHDYGDHDDEMGFPSLEGALMAISFLTFAVYLIRLVMLLFQKANNTANNGATIFFGRNRRSTDSLDNTTQEILDFIDTFDTN